jgi:hypothetical protein
MSQLSRLCSNEFLTRYGFIATPPALRRALQRSGEVRAVRDGLNSGEITENTIRDFANNLLSNLRRGEPFEFEPTIAALAVVLEQRASPFADEFLTDLANLKLAEMKMSIRVARECRAAQRELTRTILTQADLGEDSGSAGLMPYEEFARRTRTSTAEARGNILCGV